MFFVQTSTLPPSMHQNLTEHGRCFMQIRKLLTKIHVELDESSRHENIMNSRSTSTPNLKSFSTQCIAAHLICMYMIIGTVVIEVRSTLSSINKLIVMYRICII